MTFLQKQRQLHTAVLTLRSYVEIAAAAETLRTLEPPTPKQLLALRRLGFRASVATKDEAHAAIAARIEAIKQRRNEAGK